MDFLHFQREKKEKLDRGSIEYRLTVGLLHNLLIYIRDLSKIDDVLFEHEGLPHILPLAVHLIFFVWTSRGVLSKMFLQFEFLCGTPPSCLRVRGGGWWWVVSAYSILVSALVPFGFRSYWDLVGVGPRGFCD